MATESRTDVTFYAFGERLDTLGGKVEAQILARVQGEIPNLVPTTYEVSKAYLDNEILKPEGQRDLTREMCMIMALNLPKGRKTLFKAASAELLIPLAEGCILVYPTIDLPPTSFGTHDNPYSNMLVDAMTSNPVTADILMAYFTRIGDKMGFKTGDPDNSFQIKLNSTPFR
ncbi:hypothetical protein F5887DRAFT_976677 [Amanita rubescens]|nr:hypothetical protein F5887DRAFT_976677 [Amanita rubescens]